MESILYIIIRGFAVGLLISAPMGPIGVLCIKRTLDRGRWAGFYTGVGAALSDLIYCLLTGLGLSFITDFVETNRSVLQIIGSGVLLAYAIFLIRNNKKPDNAKKPEKAENRNLPFRGTFAIIVSRPQLFVRLQRPLPVIITFLPSLPFFSITVILCFVFLYLTDAA